MKKQTVIVLSVLVLIVQFLVFAPFASAAEEAVLNIPAGDYSAVPGGTIIIPVNIDVSALAVFPTDISWDFIVGPADVANIEWYTDSQEASGIYGSCDSGTDGVYVCTSGSSGMAEFATGEIQQFQITFTGGTLANSTNMTFANVLASNEMDGSVSVPIIANPSVTSLTINQPAALPTVSISSPSATATTTGSVVYIITYTGADAVTLANANVTLNKTGTANGTVAVSGSGTATRTVTISSITGNGTLGITLVADTSSNTSGSDIGVGPSTTFIVDNTAPAVSITSPNAGAIVRGNSVTLSLNATDTGGTGISDVKFYRGGNTLIGTDNSSPYSITWDTTALNGSISLTAVATDNVGNTTTSGAISVTADNTAPTAVITYSDADGIVKSGASLTITATFSEAMATSPVVKIAISGSNTLVATNMTKTDTTHYTYVRTVGSGNGTATVSLSVGTDLDGNPVTSAPTSGATFTVDNIAPTLSIGSPSSASTSGGPITYTITYTGANTVILANANVTLNKTGTANGTVAVSGSGTATRTVTISSITGNGTLGISVAAGTASDSAGNTSATAGPSATFTATNVTDTTAPTAVITYSDADGIVKSGASLTITATFSEAMATSPVVKIAISGSNTLVATNMTKTDTTHYTYVRTVGSGNGTATVSLSVGTDVAGNVITSTPTSGATFTVDNNAPTVPTTLSATAVSTSGINLSWTASTDAVGVSGYRVYRGGVFVATSTPASYSDTGLSASTAYSYTVSAFDSVLNISSQSTSASGTTSAIPVVSSGGSRGGGGGSGGSRSSVVVTPAVASASTDLLDGRAISSLSIEELKVLIKKLTIMVLQLQIKLLMMKLGR